MFTPDCACKVGLIGRAKTSSGRRNESEQATCRVFFLKCIGKHQMPQMCWGCQGSGTPEHKLKAAGTPLRQMLGCAACEHCRHTAAVLVRKVDMLTQNIEKSEYHSTRMDFSVTAHPTGRISCSQVAKPPLQGVWRSLHAAVSSGVTSRHIRGWLNS